MSTLVLKPRDAVNEEAYKLAEAFIQELIKDMTIFDEKDNLMRKAQMISIVENLKQARKDTEKKKKDAEEAEKKKKEVDEAEKKKKEAEEAEKKKKEADAAKQAKDEADRLQRERLAQEEAERKTKEEQSRKKAAAPGTAPKSATSAVPTVKYDVLFPTLDTSKINNLVSKLTPTLRTGIEKRLQNPTSKKDTLKALYTIQPF